MNDDKYTTTNIHTSSGIRTHGLSVQAIKAYQSDRAVTGASLIWTESEWTQILGLILVGHNRSGRSRFLNDRSAIGYRYITGVLCQDTQNYTNNELEEKKLRNGRGIRTAIFRSVIWKRDLLSSKQASKPDVLKLWGAPLVLWGQPSLLSEGHISFERNMGWRWNVYFDKNSAWLKYFIYQLVPVLAPNYKQHILSPTEVRTVCFSLAEHYVRSVYLNEFGWREARHSWNTVKGGGELWKLGNL
jgi:hypothetical protein